jgi:hypothetical protein
MLAAKIAFASLAVLVLAALWFAFRPHATVTTAPAPTPAPVAGVAPAPAAQAFDFVVRDGRLVSGPAAFRVRQGEQIVLRIESNANDELHLHGYDLKVRVKAGEPATLEFAATRSGRFELELHKRHTQLGALEVYPQ